MPEISYTICAVTSLASAVLLMRSAHGPSQRFLMWSALFFVGMAVNNVLLFVDRVIVPHFDWSLAPNLVMLGSIAALLYGLIWETT